MFIALMLQWWYGPGWLIQWKKVGLRTRSIGRAYSGKTLLKTLFAPWKRVVAAANPNATIQQKIQYRIDNLVSRLVGAVVRFFTLLAAVVSLVFVALLSIVLALIWPLLPIVSIAFVLKGIGVF
jgi:hypothetical protein